MKSRTFRSVGTSIRSVSSINGSPNRTLCRFTASMPVAAGIVALAGLAPINPNAAQAVTPPAIYNLGTLGGSYSVGFGVNASGQVVGQSYTASNQVHAFLYSGVPGNGGKMMDLGTLGGTYSVAVGINASGTVVGESYIPDGVPFGPYDVYHAFEYIGTPGHGGAMVDLGTLGGGLSAAQAINAAGQIVGRADAPPLNADRAFLYAGTPGAGGMMADLGSIVPGAASSASAINGLGQIVGWSDVIGGSHAFLYSGGPGGGGTDLGSFGGDSSASGINDSGLIVGASYTTGNAARHAFLYTGTPGSGGRMMDLGALGGTESEATDINSAGQVVGLSQTLNDASTHAFLYTGLPGAGGQMIDLDAWLKINNPAEGAKWTLDGAFAITDIGLITGQGHYNDGPGGLSDGTRAFLLDASSLLVPEPASFVLLGIGAAGLLWLRRRDSPSHVARKHRTTIRTGTLMKENLFWCALTVTWLPLAYSTTYGAPSDPVVFDNGNHISSGEQSSPSFGYTGIGVEDAAAFTLPNDTEITGVSWKGVYERFTAPAAADSFVIRIYNDVVGMAYDSYPTTPPITSAIFSQNVGSANRAATGETMPGYSGNTFLIYGYSASIPAFNAIAGTKYWLEVYNNGTADTWYWSGDNILVQSSQFITDANHFTNWRPLYEAYTFHLNGTVVPEPSTLVLAAFGALALLAVRRRIQPVTRGNHCC